MKTIRRNAIDDTPPRRGQPTKGDDAKIIGVHAKASRNEIEVWKRMAAESGLTFAKFLLEPLRKKTRKNIKEWADQKKRKG